MIAEGKQTAIIVCEGTGMWPRLKCHKHNRIIRTLLVALFCCTIAAMLASEPAWADDFPVKPIRLIVPYPAGGGVDLVGRTLAQGMSLELGQQVIIENKPGAGTVIGSDLVARSAPDGYTLLVNSSAHAINATLVKNLPYSNEASFDSVGLIGRAPVVLVVRAASPFKTLGDVLVQARRTPGTLTYGSSGNGTSVHLSGELFKSMAKVDITHVPYRGASPAFNDLLGGQIDMVFGTVAGMGSFVESGRMRALAVSSRQRSRQSPGTPTVDESGVPGYGSEVWYAVFAPVGTPRPAIDRLNRALNIATQSDLFRKRILAEGLVPAPGTPDDLTAYVRSEEMRWRDVINAAHVTMD